MVHGQSKDLEIGLRANSLSGLKELNSFIFKTGKEGNKFTRYRFAFANLSFRKEGDYSHSDMSFSFTVGTEKRKNIVDKLHFIHGFEPFLSFSMYYFRSDRIDDLLRLSINPGLGYLLGFQYDISKRLYVSIETIPSLSATFRTDSSKKDYYSLDAKLNSTDIALSLVYKFKTQKE